ncbi:MAG: RHS repeat-associated core domain-containing protein [Myxococcota bacterium]
MAHDLSGSDRVGSYAYNASGDRVAKTVGRDVTRYVGPHSVRSPTQLINHIFVGNTRVASLVNPDQGEAYEVEYVTDHLGSTSMLLNGAGGVEEWTALYPYGEPFAELTDGNGAGLSQRILYTGKEWDAETKFSYFGARYLDHKRAAWVTPDPDWLKQGPIGLNVYQYGNWNPIRFVDPDGRNSMALGATGGGLVCGLACALVGGAVGSVIMVGIYVMASSNNGKKTESSKGEASAGGIPHSNNDAVGGFPTTVPEPTTSVNDGPAVRDPTEILTGQTEHAGDRTRQAMEGDKHRDVDIDEVIANC